MQPVLNVEDIRAVEQRLADVGVSVSELMHRAGGAAAQEVLRLGDVSHVVVLAGLGNNGGDGWVAAEELGQGRLGQGGLPLRPRRPAQRLGAHRRQGRG